jgi:uncharacterized RDD family membrane protein YckC
MHEYVFIILRYILRCFHTVFSGIPTVTTTGHGLRIDKMSYDLQKADFWKRISAALFDFILIGILIVGVAWGLSAALKFDEYKAGLDKRYELYEAEFGIDFDISADDYKALSEETKAKYIEASERMKSDETTFYYYNMTVNLMLIIVIFSILVGFAVLEFIVPLLLGNGQTLGKKIFGIGVMRVDGVKVTPFMMFVRTILGKCTIETLIPVMVFIMIITNLTGIVGLVILFGLPLAQIILLFATNSNGRTPIHDIMSGCVTVDIASQMIFDTPEALLEYKTRIAAEKAERADY